MSLQVFLFGEPEPETTELQKETYTLGELLHKERDQKKREVILGEMRAIAEIERIQAETAEKNRPEPSKPFVSGDTLAKITLAVGLTYCGWKLETTGHVLPKAFSLQAANTALKL